MGREGLAAVERTCRDAVVRRTILTMTAAIGLAFALAVAFHARATNDRLASLESSLLEMQELIIALDVIDGQLR